MTDDTTRAHLHIVEVTVSGNFLNGPLDGAGFFFQVPPDQNLTDLRVTLPNGEGKRDVYLFDPQPDPASLEVGLRYIGRQWA